LITTNPQLMMRSHKDKTTTIINKRTVEREEFSSHKVYAIFSPTETGAVSK